MSENDFRAHSPDTILHFILCLYEKVDPPSSPRPERWDLIFQYKFFHFMLSVSMDKIIPSSNPPAERWGLIFQEKFFHFMLSVSMENIHQCAWDLTRWEVGHHLGRTRFSHTNAGGWDRIGETAVDDRNSTRLYVIFHPTLQLAWRGYVIHQDILIQAN